MITQLIPPFSSRVFNVPVGFIVFPIVFQFSEASSSQRDVCCHFGAQKPVKNGLRTSPRFGGRTHKFSRTKKIGKVFFFGWRATLWMLNGFLSGYPNKKPFSIHKVALHPKKILSLFF